MPRSRRSTTRSSATAMTAEVPGGMLSPIWRSSSSLIPLSRSLPQMPPPAPPTAALAIMVGGKISPTRPPAIAPRLAHFFPLGSAVSSKRTLPSAPCTIAAASMSSIEPSRSIPLKSSSASPASLSLLNAATNNSTFAVAISYLPLLPSRSHSRRPPARRRPRADHTTGPHSDRARGGDLRGLHQPPRGQRAQRSRAHLLGHRPHLLGPYETRQDRVDGDPASGVLAGQRAHHAQQARLGGRVGDLSRQPADGGEARDHDHASEAALAHSPDARLHGAKRAGEVDVYVPLPLIYAHRVRRCDRRGDGRIGHAHVDVVQRRELIARDIERDVAALGDVQRDHVQAVRREPARDRRPDAASRSGDERASRVSHNADPIGIEGGNDDRPLVFRAGARSALAPHHGPRDRGDRRGRAG